MTPTLLLAGCASVGNQAAICDGTALARTQAATAVAEDGGPQSVVAVARLIKQIDAGCADQ